MTGPTPKYQPTFTTEQLEEAHRLVACHQAPHVQVQRPKMVLTLAEHSDISNPELGVKLMRIPIPFSNGAKIGRFTVFIWTITCAQGNHRFFAPTQIAAIKAITCELP